MSKNIERGPFTASVSVRDGIVITRDEGSLRFAGGEMDKLLGLMGLTMGIESYPLLPARMTTTPFEVRFNAQRQIEVRRTEQRDDSQGVVFSFAEGDEVIGIVKQAVAKFIDKTTIKGTRPASVAFSIPDIPVEGR